MSSSRAHAVPTPNDANGYRLAAPVVGGASFNVIADPELTGDEPSRAFAATAR